MFVPGDMRPPIIRLAAAVIRDACGLDNGDAVALTLRAESARAVAIGARDAADAMFVRIRELEAERDELKAENLELRRVIEEHDCGRSAALRSVFPTPGEGGE